MGRSGKRPREHAHECRDAEDCDSEPDHLWDPSVFRVTKAGLTVARPPPRKRRPRTLRRRATGRALIMSRVLFCRMKERDDGSTVTTWPPGVPSRPRRPARAVRMRAVQSEAATLRLAVFPRTGLLVDALLVVAGAAFVALAAQVSIHLGFTPVPITGQTFAV